MMRYLNLVEVINLHRQIIEQSQGAMGIRDLGALESAIAQPRMMFAGEDLYPTIGYLEKSKDFIKTEWEWGKRL